MMNVFLEEIQKIGCDIMIDAPLGSYSSLQIGGKAAIAAWPEQDQEVLQLIETAKRYNVPYYILGNCSNVLVDDAGFDGMVILFGRSGHNFNEMHLVDETTLYCEAGISLQEICQFAYGNSLSGMEFAYGIPASIGGAVYMNAGAYGGEIKDILLYADIVSLDGKIHRMNAEELELSYRHSGLMYNTLFCISAVFSLKKGDKAEIDAKMQELMGRRREKQPLEYKSAGSTFKRPQGAYAAALIEQCGLKGYSVGGAEVSTKHSGFVINKGGASFDDVMAVIAHVQQVVKDKTGFALEIEPEIME